MARPIKNKKLKNQLSFRVDDDAYTMWLSKIAASNLSRSDFFREAILNNQSTIIQSDKPKKATRLALPKPSTVTNLAEKKVLFLLAQLSNNINQIAHRCNSDYKSGLISAATYTEILDQLTAISAVANPWELQ